MIARPHGDGLLVLAQHDHAMLTMPLAHAWAPAVARRDETALASGEHDNGWIEWDAAPRVDADGRPFTYRGMPSGDYRGIWRRGFARARKLGDWTGLLVSLHGTRFFDASDAEDRALLDEEGAQQREALRRLGWRVPRDRPAELPPEVEAASALVRWLDGLSLFLCEAWPSPWRAAAPGVGEVEVTRVSESEARIAPWPFAPREIAAGAPAVVVPARTFAGDAALRSALAAATPSRLSWRLRGP